MPIEVDDGFHRRCSSQQPAGDVTFTFTDMFADFGVRREFEGQGFTALTRT